jgi:hypothetical protein
MRADSIASLRISDEQARILSAARHGLVLRDPGTQRWFIANGRARPNRRERERLVSRGMLCYATLEELPDGESYGNKLGVTDRGMAALRTHLETAVDCKECGAPKGSPCTERPACWECECGQGHPPVHDICSFCGDDWGTCDCKERVCEQPHPGRVHDAEMEAELHE